MFYDLNTTQCDITSDCLALGSQFANTTCQNRVCVASNSSSGGASGNGASSGTDTGGASGTAPQGGSGGVPPECVTNADCISAHVDQPYLCRGGACLALTTADCPVLLPDNALDLLKKGDPIVLGGYALMTNPLDPHQSQAVINWDLAFDEINTATLGGLPSQGGSGQLRPVLGLVCQGTADDITPSLAHLTQEVGTPGILTTLSADKLLAAFNFTRSTDYVNAGSKPVFFMSTGSADLRLANLQDDGLVWHMLGDPRVLAATIAGLLNRMAVKVQADRVSNCPSTPCADDPSTPLRVTLVYSDEPTMLDLNTVLTTPDTAHPEAQLTFNGHAAIDQLPSATGPLKGAFREVGIESAKVHTTPNVANAITDLESNPPHIVVAIATSEFAKTVMPALEDAWGASGSASEGMQRPYYLASHLLYNTPELLTTTPKYGPTITPPLWKRLAGVNYAEAQDTHSKQLYASYLGRLQNSYTGTLTLDGTENYYDGAYSLLYALAAAARDNPDGTDIASGLENRVFSTSSSAVSVDIGPSAVGASVGMLSSPTYKMSMWGTMGAPNFDRASGTRISTTSAWCIQINSKMTAWAYQADGIIYDPDTRMFADNSAGKPTCMVY